MSIYRTWKICCLVNSNQTRDVFVYLIILCTCLSPGHNEVSKTHKSPNPCEAFNLLGQTNNNIKKCAILDIDKSMKKIK